jgi:hypothetical protein
MRPARWNIRIGLPSRRSRRATLRRFQKGAAAERSGGTGRDASIGILPEKKRQVIKC